MLKKRLQSYWLAFFLLFLLFFLDFLNLLSLGSLQGFANWWKSQNYSFLQKVQQPAVRLTNFWNLSARLEDLQYRYSEAAASMVRVETLERENQELRSLIENTDRTYTQTTVSAPIISFAQSYVAVGKEASIQPGSAVLHHGTLLGLIEEVGEKQSSVTLLTKMHDQALLAKTNQGVFGLIRGNGREVLLTEVASDANLSEGDLVFTQSAPGIKDGLFIGRIISINKDNPASATQTAIVEQLVSFFEVALVEIQ